MLNQMVQFLSPPNSLNNNFRKNKTKYKNQGIKGEFEKILKEREKYYDEKYEKILVRTE